MAKRKVSMTKMKSREVEKRVYGGEPSFPSNHHLDKVEYIQTLNWYSRTLDKDTNKKYVLEFLKEQGRKDDLMKARALSPDWMTSTYGAIARLLSRKVLIPDTGHNWLDTKLNELFVKYEAQEKENRLPCEVRVNQTPNLTIQDRMLAKARHIAGKVDDIFDDVVWENTEEIDVTDRIHNLLHKEQASGQVAAMTADLLQPHLDELLEIPNNKDLKEAYSCYKKEDIKRFVSFYKGAVEACRQFNENVKRTKVRKPRKARAKKDVAPEKVLAGFKYQKAFKDWQLVSLDPSKILGADEVWLYIPKYRDLKILCALDRGGIGIKGQTFTNVDESKSLIKRLRDRDAQNVVTRLAVASKRQAKNILKETKGSERPARLRSSDDHLILVVYK